MKPVIAQPRPLRRASNAGWTIPLLVAEFVIIAILLMVFK